MKKFNFTLLLLVLFFFAFAKKVDLETAKIAAKNIYYLKANNLFSKSLDEIQLFHVYTELYNNEPIYYVFNVNNEEGFVIISADDIAYPIIGYSFKGVFPVFNQPPHFATWMNNYREQIIYGKTNNIKATKEIEYQWAELLQPNPPLKKEKATQPLLIHTWNQDWPWNAYCPEDANGPGGRVYVGCVAVAMAQLMKYYNHPVQGTGTHTNYSIWNGGYGNLTVNFAQQTYLWDNMPNLVNSTNYHEVAKLLYHCSVATNMNYGPNGSGSLTSRIPTALKTYFFYASPAQYVQKSSYSQTAWENLLKQQIDNKQPMAYQGSDGTEGHAWNCDGYNGNQFHMNWGWSGSGNGYYALDNLIVSGYNFNSNQGAVINVYPSSNYPQWCSGTRIINGRGGAFNDGSGNLNYQHNIDCKYLIQPECANFITLTFDRFDLAAGDNVYIYDGATENDPLLATLNSSNTPGTSSYNSTGGALLIRFVTNSTDNATGWYASYTTTTCSGTKNLTDPSGIVEDGSKSCNYDNSKVCTWNIEPPSTTSFTVNFLEFDFPSNDQVDNLKIYKNNTSSANLIGTYTSANIPPSTLNIPGASKLIVKFTTNASINAGGFKLSYTATQSNINSHSLVNNIGIFPNPFNEDTNISYCLTENNNSVRISVENILGQTIAIYEAKQPNGEHIISLKSFTNNLSKGLYFIKININNFESVHKVVHK